MSLAEALINAGGKGAISQVASKLGIEEGTAAQAVAMILPALTNGMKKNAEADGGGGLQQALNKGKHDRYLDNPELLGAQETKQDGNGILGHVLGSKEASRAVAATVASAVGIENQTVKEMLPLVASMAMGALAKGTQKSTPEPSAEQSSEGGLSGTLGSLLQSGDAGKLLGSLFG